MSHNRFTQKLEKQRRVIESHRANHLASVQRSRAPSKLVPLKWNAQYGIRREDITTFEAAATGFDHIICVRATNPKSLGYIGKSGKPGFTPKPVDCKPKTAASDGYVRMAGKIVKCGGLVVDPTVVGNTPFNRTKLGKASDAWTKFVSDKSSAEQLKKAFRRREGGFYAVDMYEQSERFGCLMLCGHALPAEDFNLADSAWQEFKHTHMNYLHGDYDLYALIDLGELSSFVAGPRNLFSPNLEKELLHGMDHLFTKQFPRVQEFLNNGIGAEIIQHGSHVNLFGHDEDDIFVFYPYPLGSYQVNAKEDVNIIKQIFQHLFNQETHS